MSTPAVDYSPSAAEPATLVELLRRRAMRQPDQRVYTFLVDGEADEVHLTYEELDRRARRIAAVLQSHQATGERALLLYPPGLDYIAGFFGCLYAGVIAVPAYPPDPSRLDRTLPRLQAMIADAQATIVLTTSPILSLAEFIFTQAPDLAALRWLATDQLSGEAESDWREPAITRKSLAFLQYTSGSTRAPRGVMLSHGNLLHNSALIHQAFAATLDEVGVIWLPPYHDMGLIGGILQPVYGGFPCVLMSPVSFLQYPFRWLSAISRYKATVSGGPNFAYDLCARKITPAQIATLDLSNWSVAFNGAEPIRPETLRRFAETFEPCGFRWEAFYPCYGLAEATLFVSGSARNTQPLLEAVQKTALTKNQVATADPADPEAQLLVGCGHPAIGESIRIVDAESLAEAAPGHVGEIWIASPSIAQGYWNQPEETAQTFEATLAETGEGPFLRTGDLGFIKDGEVFVTGRVKDLIIIRGRNLYPQDIEATVEQAHPAVRPGCVAAFSVEVEGEERLAVVQEVDARKQVNVDEVASAIRRAVAETHEVQAHAVVLIAQRTIPKTSSGKIQRRACKAEFLAGTLEVAGVSVVKETDSTRPPLSLTREALLSAKPDERRSLLEDYLRERVAHALRLAPSQVDPAQPLSALGIDSVMVVDLAAEIEAGLGLSLPPSDLLKGTTITQLAWQMLTEVNTPTAPPPASAAEPLPEFPLSHGQRALWFLHQLAPESGAYNIAYGVRVRAELDTPVLRRAFDKLVVRHPMLRTTFAAPRGEPVQRVHDGLGDYFHVEDASAWSEAQLKERLAEEVYRPFDLERGPLLRVFVFTRSPQEHILLMSMHHIVTDMWSMALLLYEAGALYPAEKSGKPVALKTLRDQYADFVRQQNELLAGAEGERLWAFWKDYLAGELSLLNLPTDRPRPPVQTYRGSSQTIRLNAEVTKGLAAIAKAHNATLYMTLLAAFQVLLYRYTGQEDFLIGSPKAGRNQKWSRLVGYFVNTVVLRSRLDGNPTFAALLDRVRDDTTAVFDHDAYPLPLLVERLKPVRDLSRSPLFQVMFAWQKTTRLVDGQGVTSLALGEAGKGMELGGLMLESLALEDRIVPFDLSLLVAEAGDDLVALLEYNTDLFDAATIARLLGHFETLLEAIALNPDQPISTAPLLTEAERRQLLIKWNATQTDDPPAPPVHHLFEAQVERTPDSLAVVLGNEQLTYRELNQRANQLAHHLQSLGVGPETIVGVCVERSLDMVVALLGILKSGGAYLPLDPAYPPERLAFMLKDSDAKVLLTQRPLLDRLPARTTHDIRLDADWGLLTHSPITNNQLPITPSNLAYLIYTSGSTGEPKGVLITHQSLANHCRDACRHYQIGPRDRILQFASLNFDPSLEQILTALIVGATLYLRGPELLDGRQFNQMVAEHSLTVVNVPPAYWHQWAQAWVNTPGLAPNSQLRLVIIGGDAMLAESLQLWQKTPMRAARLLNAYGPTEATITATTYEVPPQVDGLPARARLPIGRPLANRQTYILDRCNSPVPIGVAGELHLGGVGIARGYLNHPELTTEKFIEIRELENSLILQSPRLYKTGDLARYLADGNIEFLGRVDQQVKIRGFRVEPGEIEAMLSQHPAVREAVVVARDEGADKRLTAYVVPKTPGISELSAELQNFLRQKLPVYMIPSAFVMMDALPLNISGKVDRRALPEPEGFQSGPTTPFVAPRTPVEEELAQIWAGVLGVSRVGIHDSFFELGGHSLLATQLISRVRDAFNVELPLRNLFETPTIAGLALLIVQQQAAQQSDEDLDQLLTELEQMPNDEAGRLLTEETQ
jgi:amino acid adenylation domain-containing protein